MLSQQKAFEERVFSGSEGETRSLFSSIVKENVLRSKQSVSNLSKKLFGSKNSEENITKLFDNLVTSPDSNTQVSFEEQLIVKVTPPNSTVIFEPSSWTSDKSWDRIPKSDGSISNAAESPASQSLKSMVFDDDIMFDRVLDEDEDCVSFEASSNETLPEPEGRKQRFATNEAGAELFIPFTQDSPHRFMTSDMLLEQETAFERMGTGKSAAAARAKMQSAHLKSDMQAFKAANPGCLMQGKFIRIMPRFRSLAFPKRCS